MSRILTPERLKQMLPTIVSPAEWAERKPPIDVIARRKKVLGNVLQDGKRRIYKIEPSLGFAGDDERKAVCLFLSGCSFLCQFCFVNPQSLIGAKGIFLSPAETLAKLAKGILRTRNPNVQLNGGETFLTPDWTLELIGLLCKFFEKDCRFTSERKPGRIWCDTMGFDLMREPQVFELLRPYRKHVALFISTKGHPADYEIVSRVPSGFADDPFLALERAWQHGLVAMPEVIDRFFWPQRMDWYLERLRRIHPNAPLILHIDKYSPANRIPWAPDRKMKTIGFRPNKSDPERNAPLREEVLSEWQGRLTRIFGRRKTMFDCDLRPDASFRLVEKLILGL